MLAVYIILAIIFILFITAIILAIRKYNNEEVSKELEYVSENFDVDEINNDASVSTSEVKESVKPVEAVEVTQPPVEPVIEKVAPALQERVQEPVDNTPPPILELQVPEQTDEEITIEDTAIKEENVSDSVEVKDNALVGSESGEEISITDNSLNVQEDGEEAFTIKTEDTPAPPDQVKQEVDYSNQAFGNNFDGNNSINRNFTIEEPNQSVSMKTEIWDFSEIQNGEIK